MERAEALHRYLDIDKKKVEFEEEQLRTQAPDFWEDPARAQEQMKKVKSIEKWLDDYKEVRQYADELQLAFDFFHDDMVSEEEVDADYAKAIKAIEALELKNMLRQKEDPMEAVIKINSGAGGTESQDWASMLMRMYMRWCEAHGYRCTVSNLQEGDEAGIKSVTMEVEGGEYAYGYLKSENGVHRTRFVRAERVARTSTRWSRESVCAIGIRIPTRAKRKKFSSRTPRRATSPRTVPRLCCS